MLFLMGWLLKSEWIVLMIEVIGWWLVKVCMGVGIDVVGMNVELMKGRKISG